jgi:hypothetical protein
VLEEGTLLAFDFGAYWHGEVSFKPNFDDSRMVLRNQPLPPSCGDSNYADGLKINVLVQRIGLCTLLSDREGQCSVLQRMWDAFVFAPATEAGKLPVYKLAAARSYPNRYKPGTVLYSPVYLPFNVMDRPPAIFGPRLIDPPKRPQPLEALEAPKPESDALFDGVAKTGEVLPPDPAPAAPKARRKNKSANTGQQYDDDLDDQLPF